MFPQCKMYNVSPNIEIEQSRQAFGITDIHVHVDTLYLSQVQSLATLYPVYNFGTRYLQTTDIQRLETYIDAIMPFHSNTTSRTVIMDS